MKNMLIAAAVVGTAAAGLLLYLQRGKTNEIPAASLPQPGGSAEQEKEIRPPVHAMG